MKFTNGVVIGLAVCVLSQGVAEAITVFDSRAAWESAFNGPHWDVDLAGAPNALKDGDTLGAGVPIYLPPQFAKTLSFNSDLSVQNGAGWHNYITPGGGDPLVLGTTLLSLTGTFSLGHDKFGFEVLPSLSSTITLTLSDGTQFSKFVDATGSPQFLGWVLKDGSKIESFTLTSDNGGFAVGNFVVPEGGTTVALFGLVLLALAGVRRHLS